VCDVPGHTATPAPGRCRGRRGGTPGENGSAQGELLAGLQGVRVGERVALRCASACTVVPLLDAIPLRVSPVATVCVPAADAPVGWGAGVAAASSALAPEPEPAAPETAEREFAEPEFEEPEPEEPEPEEPVFAEPAVCPVFWEQVGQALMPCSDLTRSATWICCRPSESELVESLRSSSTIDGCWWATTASASAALEASPTMANWGSRSSTERRPWRTMAWSSTSTMILLTGFRRRHAGQVSRSLDRDRRW